MGQPIQELATIRHISSSGRLDSWWEFLPGGSGLPKQQNRILAMIKLGSAKPVEVEIPVCSHRNPVPGCWILVRRGEHHYLLTAGKLPLDMNKIARSEAYHPSLPVGSLVLADAPSDVAEELSRV